MSTAKEIRDFVRPFLERHPELIMIKRRLLRLPVRHCVVGIAFNPAHYRGEIDLSWYVSFLYTPPPFFSGSFSGRMDRAWGVLGEEGLQDRVFAEMELVLSEIIPAGTSPETAFEAQKHATPFLGEMVPESQALLFAALGRFDEACIRLETELGRQRRHIAADLSSPNLPKFKPSVQQHYDDWATKIVNLECLLKNLIARDVAAVATLLHEWEASAAKALGVERYWEPSPFPFEAA